MPWEQMDRSLRLPASSVERTSVPGRPGVYAMYREGVPVYVGKATSLRSRVCGNHLGRGTSMTSSALRRNVAELLGIASSADIKTRRYRTTPEDARSVTEWIAGCEFAWLECATVSEAEALERELKLTAHRPLPLTKR